MLAVDCVGAYLLTFVKYAFIEVIGDLMLGEVAVLFILAGLLDFGSSIGMIQFRRVVLASKEGYSSSKHKESERKASVLCLTGLFLFSILIVATIYKHV
jgi:hypothetical protein